MNLTIPIRAESSTSSESQRLRGSSSSKLLTKSRRSTRTHRIFSMMAAAFLVGALVLGSVGTTVHIASAKSNFNNLNYYNNANARRQSGSTSSSNNSNTTPSAKTATPSTAKTTPAATTSTATTPAAVTPPTAAPAPKVTATPKAAAVQPVTPKPVDTTPAINAMTTAQADKSTKPVTYTSDQISNDLRNHILIAAGVAAVTGGLLYTISLIGGASSTKRTIPVRYILPVKEVVSN